jgi:AmiR/NasT family two-component response regulator
MSDSNLPQFSRLNITLVCEPGAESMDLIRHLQRTRASVRHVWPVPETVGENTDLVLCEYVRGISRRLAWLPGESKAALILLLPQSGYYELKEVHAALPDAVLYRPYVSHMIDVALTLALDHFGYIRRQRLRIARLDENIKALRDIEKAKHVIMASRKVGENEAYRIMRDIAMERRTTIAAVAEKLVDSSNLLI